MAETHKQITIYNPIDQQEVDVDEGLADLLNLCWKLGINTQWSCQEMDIIDKTESYPHLTSGAATICFHDPSIAKKFMDIIKNDNTRSLRDWKIAVLWNVGLDWTIVSFPPADIKWVESKLGSMGK